MSTELLKIHPNGADMNEVIKGAKDPQRVLTVVKDFLLPHEVEVVLDTFEGFRFQFNQFPLDECRRLISRVPRIGEFHNALEAAFPTKSADQQYALSCQGVRRGPIDPHYDPPSIPMAASIHLQDLNYPGYTQSKAFMFARRDAAHHPGDRVRESLAGNPFAFQYEMRPGDLCIIGEGVMHEVQVQPIVPSDGSTGTIYSTYDYLDYENQRLALVQVVYGYSPLMAE